MYLLQPSVTYTCNLRLAPLVVAMLWWGDVDGGATKRALAAKRAQDNL